MHVPQVNMNVNIPTPPQPSDVTSVVHVPQVNMNVNIPTPPQPSDVTSVAHVPQVNMNVNIPTPPQPSDKTSVVHVPQVNMNVKIPTPPQPSDKTSVAHVPQVNMNVNIPTPPHAETLRLMGWNTKHPIFPMGKRTSKTRANSRAEDQPSSELYYYIPRNFWWSTPYKSLLPSSNQTWFPIYGGLSGNFLSMNG